MKNVKSERVIETSKRQNVLFVVKQELLLFNIENYENTVDSDMCLVCSFTCLHVTNVNYNLVDVLDVVTKFSIIVKGDYRLYGI